MTIPEDADGRIDVAHLEAELRRYADRPLKVGSFSAASNVTGIVSDVDAIATVLHRHGALACFDYAAAGPYLPIDMRGKDAVFLSPHKFPGGPGTPGVLVAKRSLLRRPVPTVPGGGTVLFVSPAGQSYHPDPAMREEAGTPAIVESIRAGLVFGAQGRGRRRGDPPARGRLRAPRARVVGHEPEPADPRQPRARAARDRVVRRPPPARDAALELRRRACSATCSASRRAAAASAPARTSTAPIRSTTRGRRRWRRRPGSAATARRSPSRASASTTSSARRCSTTSSRPCT